LATPHQLRHYGHQMLELAAAISVDCRDDPDASPAIDSLENHGMDLLRAATKAEQVGVVGKHGQRLGPVDSDDLVGGVYTTPGNFTISGDRIRP
jgi:hypothetical protein